MADLTLSVGFNPADLQSAINSVVNRQYNIRGINTNSIQQPLGRIAASASEFEKSMEAANARVLAFGASAGAIYVVKKAFETLVTSTIEVERQMVEINSVLGLSSRQLGTFSSQVFAAANSVSVSFSDASKAAIEFARQGLDVEETLRRTRDSLILARVAGMDFSDSATAVTAALNSFSNELLRSTDLVDRLTNADANFAVSAGDLAEAIKRVGSSAADANVSLNQTIALVTAAQQTTSRGGAVIGNSFKTIFTRLGRSSVLSDLEELGIATKNASGDALPLVQVLKNLSSTYESLSSSQRNYVAELVGGVYQINILKATLSDLGKSGSVYEEALKTVENSTGSAERRIEQLNQTLSAKLNVTLNRTIELAAAIGSKTIAPVFKGVLDQANSGLGNLTDSVDGEGIGSKIADGLLGGIKGILQGPGAALLGFFATKLAGNFGGFLSSSISSFSGMNSAAQQQAQIQQQILGYLQRNPQILQNIHSGALTINQAHSLVLGQIRQQNALLDYQNNISGQIATRARASGVRVAPAAVTPAAGFIPNFNSQIVGQMMENAGAEEHGYTAGRAYETTVHDGNGNAIPTFVNSREKVENFENSEGNKATLVTPPNGFGKNTMRAAAGFVPNFAKVYRGVNPKYGDTNPGGQSIGIGNKLVGALGPNYTDNEGMAKVFGSEVISKKVNDKKLLKLDEYNQVIGLYQKYQSRLSPGLAGKIQNSSGEEQLALIQQAGSELRAILKKQKYSGVQSPMAPGDAKYLAGKGLGTGNLVIPFGAGFVPNFGKNLTEGQERALEAQKRAKSARDKGAEGEEKTLEELIKQYGQGSIVHESEEKAQAPFDFRVKTPGGDIFVDSKNVENFGKAQYQKEVAKKLWNQRTFDDLKTQTLDYTDTPVEIYIPEKTYKKSRSLKGASKSKVYDLEISKVLEGSGIKAKKQDKIKFKSSIKTFASGFVPNFGRNTPGKIGEGARMEAYERIGKDGEPYIVKAPKKRGSRRGEAIADAKEQEAMSGRFAENLSKFPWFDAVKQTHVGGGVLKQPLVKGNTLGKVLRTAYPRWGDSAISGALGSFQKFFQKIGLPFDNFGAAGNIIIPEQHEARLTEVLKKEPGNLSAKMFGHKGGLPPGSLKIIDYAKGFIPNFARVLDFDGTLGTAPEGITHKDTYHGWSASKMVPTPLVDKIRKEQEASRKAGKPIEDIIVTARGRESIPYINEWVKKHGLTVADIRATGDKERYPKGMTTPNKKVLEIKDAGMLKPGVTFNDDDKRNLTAAKRAAKKEGIKGFKTSLANYGNKGIGQMAGGFIPNFGMVSAEVSAQKKSDARKMSSGISNRNETGYKRQKQYADEFEELSAIAVGNKMTSDYPVTSLTSIPTKNLKGAAGFGGGKNFAGYDSIYKLLTSNEDLARILGIQINQPSYVPLSAKGGSSFKISEVKRQMDQGGQLISALQARGDLEKLDVGNPILAHRPGSLQTRDLSGLFSEKGSFGKAGYVSKIARASGGFVPNFNSYRYSSKTASGRQASRIRGLNQRISIERTMEAESSYGKGAELRSDPRIGLYVAQPSQPSSLSSLIAQDHPEGLAAAMANSKKSQGLSGGFVPNFVPTTLYRGVGGGRIKDAQKGRGDKLSSDEIENIIFSKKKIGTEGEKNRNKAFYPELSIKNLAKYMREHQEGGTETGLLSTSYSENVATGFANKSADRFGETRTLGELQIPSGRILNTAKIKKMISRFGAKKASSVILNSSSEANAARGRKNKFVGFDVNDLLENNLNFNSPDLSREREVALMSGGFIPNFNSYRYSSKTASGRQASRVRGLNQRISIERAMETESSYGKGAELRSDPRIGPYVAQPSQPSSLSSLIARDHPEGLAAAMAKSKKSQGLSGGFVPNFAEESGSSGGSVALASAVLGSIAAMRQNTAMVRQNSLSQAANTASLTATGGRERAAALLQSTSVEEIRNFLRTGASSTLSRRQQGIISYAGADPTRRAALDQSLNARDSSQRLEQQNNMSGGRMLAVGLMSSVPSGIAASMDEGPAKAGASAFGEASSFAASALTTFPGQIGLAVAAVSILAGGARAAYLANNSLAQSALVSAGVMKEQQKNFESGGQQVLKAYQTHQEALYNSSISVSEVARLSQEIAVSMEKIPQSLRRDFESRMRMAASQEERSRVFNEMNSKMIKDQEVTENLAKSTEKSESVGQYFNNAFGGGQNRYTNTTMFAPDEADKRKQKVALDRDVLSVTSAATSTESGRKKYESLIDPSKSARGVDDFKAQLANLVPPEAKAMIMGLSEEEAQLYQLRMRQIEATRKQGEMISEVTKKYVEGERMRKRQAQEEIDFLRERAGALKKLADSFSTMGISSANTIKTGKIDAQTKSFGTQAGDEKRFVGAQTQAVIDARSSRVSADSTVMQGLMTQNSKTFEDSLAKGKGQGGKEGSPSGLSVKESKANIAITEALGKVDTTTGSPQEIIDRVRASALASPGESNAKEITKRLEDPVLKAELAKNTAIAAASLKVNESAEQEQVKAGIIAARTEQSIKAFGGIENFLSKQKTKEDRKDFNKAVRSAGSGNADRSGRGAMQLILSAQKDLGGSLSEKSAGGLKESAVGARARQIRQEATRRISSLSRSNLPAGQKQALIGAYQEARNNSGQIARNQIEEAAKLERAPLEQLKRLDTISKGLDDLNKSLTSSGIVIKSVGADFFRNNEAVARGGSDAAIKQAGNAAKVESSRAERSSSVNTQGTDLLSGRDAKFNKEMKDIEKSSGTDKEKTEQKRAVLRKTLNEKMDDGSIVAGSGAEIDQFANDTSVEKLDASKNNDAKKADLGLEGFYAKLNQNVSIWDRLGAAMDTFIMDLAGRFSPMNIVRMVFGKNPVLPGNPISPKNPPKQPTIPPNDGMSRGGLVTSSSGTPIPTRSNGDNILSTLQTGEIVIPRNEVPAYLDRMKVPGFAKGLNSVKPSLFNKGSQLSAAFGGGMARNKSGGIGQNLSSMALRKNYGGMNTVGTSTAHLAGRTVGNVFNKGSQLSAAFGGGMARNKSGGIGQNLSSMALRKNYGGMNTVGTSTAHLAGRIVGNVFNKGSQLSAAFGNAYGGASTAVSNTYRNVVNPFKAFNYGMLNGNKPLGFANLGPGGASGINKMTHGAGKAVAPLYQKFKIAQGGYQANLKPGAGASRTDRMLAATGRVAGYGNSPKSSAVMSKGMGLGALAFSAYNAREAFNEGDVKGGLLNSAFAGLSLAGLSKGKVGKYAGGLGSVLNLALGGIQVYEDLKHGDTQGKIDAGITAASTALTTFGSRLGGPVGTVALAGGTLVNFVHGKSREVNEAERENAADDQVIGQKTAIAKQTFDQSFKDKEGKDLISKNKDSSGAEQTLQNEKAAISKDIKLREGTIIQKTQQEGFSGFGHYFGGKTENEKQDEAGYENSRDLGRMVSVKNEMRKKRFEGGNDEQMANITKRLIEKRKEEDRKKVTEGRKRLKEISDTKTQQGGGQAQAGQAQAGQGEGREKIGLDQIIAAYKAKGHDLSDERKTILKESMDKGLVSGSEYVRFAESGVASPNLARFQAHNRQNNDNAKKAKSMTSTANFLKSQTDYSEDGSISSHYRAEAMLAEADQLSKAKEYVPKTPLDLANDKKKADDDKKKSADLKRADALSKQADFYQNNDPQKANRLREQSDKLKNDLQSGGRPIAASEVAAASPLLTNAQQAQEEEDRNIATLENQERIGNTNSANLNITLNQSGQDSQLASLKNLDPDQMENLQKQLDEQVKLQRKAKVESENNKRKMLGLSPVPIEAS